MDTELTVAFGRRRAGDNMRRATQESAMNAKRGGTSTITYIVAGKTRHGESRGAVLKPSIV